MNTGATSERVYEALRLRLTQSALRPGDRIDPAQLAEEFGSSVTPVRDALHILIGQGLVGTGVGEGFYIPHIDEPGLHDLYDWNADLLTAALRRFAPRDPVEPFQSEYGDDLVVLTAALFSKIAQRSGSREHALAMRWANARFALVRHIEQEVLIDIPEELARLSDALREYDRRGLGRIIKEYHSRRKRVAGQTIRALYRSRDTIPIM